MANKKKSEKLSAEEIYNKQFSTKSTKKEKENNDNDSNTVADPDNNAPDDSDKKDNQAQESYSEQEAPFKASEKQSKESFDDGTSDIFDSPPIQRDYTKAQPVGEQIESTPEPSFMPPPIDDQNEFSGQPAVDPNVIPGQPGQSPSSGTTKTTKTPPQHANVNPALDDLATKDKKKAAGYVADTILGFYKIINDKAATLVKFNESRAVKKAAAGKFEMATLGVWVDMPDGSSITVKQWLDHQARGVDGLFVVTDEFVEDVRPLLIEVLMKHNIGATVEQRLFFAFGQDIVLKTINAIQIVQDTKYMLNTCEKAYIEHKKIYGATGQPLRMQQYAQPQQEQPEQPKREPTTEAVVEETKTEKTNTAIPESEKQESFVKNINPSQKKKEEYKKSKNEKIAVVEDEEVLRDNAETENKD